MDEKLEITKQEVENKSVNNVAIIPDAPVVAEDVNESVPEHNTIINLVNGLHRLMDDARSIVLKYQQKSSLLDQREKNVSAKEVAVAGLSSKLMEREDACKKVENVVKLHADATSLSNSAQSRLNAATEAEQRLRQVMEEENSKIREARLQMQKESTALEAQRKRIDDEVSKRVQEILGKMGIFQPVAAAPVEKPEVTIPVTEDQSGNNAQQQ